MEETLKAKKTLESLGLSAPPSVPVVPKEASLDDEEEEAEEEEEEEAKEEAKQEDEKMPDAEAVVAPEAKEEAAEVKGDAEDGKTDDTKRKTKNTTSSSKKRGSARDKGIAEIAEKMKPRSTGRKGRKVEARAHATTSIKSPKPEYMPKTKVKVRSSKRGPEGVVKKERKPHRFRPGTRANMEIRRLQRTTDSLVQKAPLNRVIREVAQDMSVRGEPLRFQKNALAALHEASEYFMTDLLKEATRMTALRQKKTTNDRDLAEAVRKVAGYMELKRYSL